MAVLFSGGSEAQGASLISEDGVYSRVREWFLPDYVILDTGALFSCTSAVKLLLLSCLSVINN